MTGTRTTWNSVGAILVLGAAAVVVSGVCAIPAHAVVKISDGFEDGDRDNNGIIEPFDTDMNLNGTIDDPTADAALIARGIHEVKTANNASDVGIKWSGIRSYDTATNLVKVNVKIFNDAAPLPSESASQVFGTGYALGAEARGGGSSFIGAFNSGVSLGPVAGDRLVASFDFRVWEQSTNPTPNFAVNELRWGLYQDTDNELGQSGPYGTGFVSAPPGAMVQWGKDDGNFFSGVSSIGAEGDKGIRAQLPLGTSADPLTSRISWEYNKLNVNGTTNNARILEGNGTTNNGDTGTIASPVATCACQGSGGVLTDGTTPAHTSMQLTRNADGTIQVSLYVGATQILSNNIDPASTDYAAIGPPPESFNYVAFRDTADYDWAIDNFKVEVFGSNAGSIAGDYNGDNKVDAIDYTIWRDTLGSTTDLRANGNTSGASATVIDIDDYNVWKANFGTGLGSGGGGVGGGTVPEPSSLLLGLLAAGVIVVVRSRRF